MIFLDKSRSDAVLRGMLDYWRLLNCKVEKSRPVEGLPFPPDGSVDNLHFA